MWGGGSVLQILQGTTERHSPLQCSGGLSLGVAERCFGDPQGYWAFSGLYQSWRQGRVKHWKSVEEATPPEQDGLAQVAARLVLVHYVDDPDLYHHRVVRKGLEGNKAQVVTPDRETFVTELAIGEPYDDLKRLRNGRLPTG